MEKRIARPNGECKLANRPKRLVKPDTKPKQGKDNLRQVVSRAGMCGVKEINGLRW